MCGLDVWQTITRNNRNKACTHRTLRPATLALGNCETQRYPTTTPDQQTSVQTPKKRLLHPRHPSARYFFMRGVTPCHSFLPLFRRPPSCGPLTILKITICLSARLCLHIRPITEGLVPRGGWFHSISNVDTMTVLLVIDLPIFPVLTT